jgi:hypothetical protein
MAGIAVLMVIAVPMVIAAQAPSNQILQIWKCEMEEGTTELQVEELAQAWLEGARKMDGGAEFRVMVLFPVATGDTGNTDFHFMVMAPTFTDWGKFWDAYNDDSPAAVADDMHQNLVACPDAALWEAHEIGVG